MTGSASKDPVCGMMVSAETEHRYTHDGKGVLFCSSRCRDRFVENPTEFIHSEPARISKGTAPDKMYTCPMHPEVRQAGRGSCPKCGMALELVTPKPTTATEWTCPMHPEIIRPGPGTCPICGMALEPRTVVPSDDENRALRDMTKRFWFSAALTAPLVVAIMGEMISAEAFSSLFPPGTRVFLELVLASPVCLWAAWPFYVRAIQSVKNRSLNMFTLIGLGVSVAYVYSVIAAVMPGIFPASFRAESGEVATYFEAAGVIVTLILLGQVLELRARSQTGAAIRKLLGMAAKSARRIRENGAE